MTDLLSRPAAATTARLACAAGLVLLGVAVSFLLGLAWGSRALPLPEVLTALARRDAGDASLIVLDQRLPRTLLGLVVGAALGVGGAVAQLLTCNPLADPGLLGVSAGARWASCSAPVALPLPGAPPTRW
jgi:iron complex transport system permease protein